MIYSETQSGSKNILYDLEFLDESESYKSIPELNLMESKRLNQNILNLEEVCEYLNSDYNMTISDIIKEVSSINGVDEETIAFSINPSTIYENDDMLYLMEALYNNGFAIYKRYDPYSNISQGINCFIEACIKSNSLEPLDILEECIFNEQALGSFNSGDDYDGPSLKDSALAAGRFGLRYIAKQATDYASSKLLDDRKIITRTEKDENGNVKVDKDGKPITRKEIRIGRNEKIHSKFGSDKDPDSFKYHLVDNAAEDFRKHGSDHVADIAEGLLSKGYNLLRGRNSQAQSQMVNKLDNATHMLQRSMYSNPKKRGFFQRIIDKLIALKNKILEILRGKR